MIHCDTIYTQTVTVWWSTVILYMHSQRQCDDPLWYYILYCITMDHQTVTDYIYSITVDHHTVSDYIYSITVDHHTVSNCTYIVSQWIITVCDYMYRQRQCDDPLWYYICTDSDSVMIHCDTIYAQSETEWWSTVILYMYSQKQCDDPLWYLDHHTVSNCTYIVSQWIITVCDCTYIVSQWIITLSVTVHI
jgi:hypothetical protein